MLFRKLIGIFAFFFCFSSYAEWSSEFFEGTFRARPSISSEEKGDKPFSINEIQFKKNPLFLSNNGVEIEMTVNLPEKSLDKSKKRLLASVFSQKTESTLMIPIWRKKAGTENEYQVTFIPTSTLSHHLTMPYKIIERSQIRSFLNVARNVFPDDLTLEDTSKMLQSLDSSILDSKVAKKELEGELGEASLGCEESAEELKTGPTRAIQPILNKIKESPESKNSQLAESMLLPLSHQTPPKLNPEVLDEKAYKSVLAFTDYSYSIVKTASLLALVEGGKELNKAQEDDLELFTSRSSIYQKELSANGWEIETIAGKTGKGNQNDDSAAAILGCNKRLRQVTVAFHGSHTSGVGDGMVASKINGKGDWGSNYDSKAVDASQLGLHDLPPGILMHQGFANNYKSVQEPLNTKIRECLNSFDPVDGPNTVWVTGHSKGAAMASIAAPLIKANLSNLPKNRIRAILFSAPLAYYGDSSATWADKTLGPGNMLRVNVGTDPVTIAGRLGSLPKKAVEVGVLVRDSVQGVKSRLPEHVSFSYGDPKWDVKNSPRSLASSAIQKSSNFVDHTITFPHYGSKRHPELEFDPEAVIPFSELNAGLKDGYDYEKRRLKKGFWRSFGEHLSDPAEGEQFYFH